MPVKANIRLLIVEDSDDDARLAVEELRRNGYNPEFKRVQTREELEDALAQPWDAVLADYSLPGFSGLDALEIVRKQDPDMPFIIVSGLISEETAVEAMRRGAQDYVLKGNLARLAPAIDRELREAGIRRARRQAEAELRQSEQILQSIVDSSNAAIYLKDINGRFILVNERAASVLGTSKQDAIGKTDHDLLPAATADCRRRHDREVVETCSSRKYEEIMETEQGTQTFVSAKFPVYDSAGTIYGVGEVSTDISELVQLRRELEQALERERHFSLLLQRALLPAVPDMGSDYEVAAEYVSSAVGGEIGGDFYDVFRIDHNRAGILVGDVSGKGIEAAAAAAATRSTVHALVHQTASPSQALAKTNEVMCLQPAEPNTFVTAFLALVSLRTGRLTYASAGHPPPVMRRADGSLEMLHLGQTALAIVKDQRFDEHCSRFGRGDMLVLYTDGISEARRGARLFGTWGIKRTLLACSNSPARQVARTLLDAAADWARGALRDDAVVVVIRRNPTQQ